MFPVFQYWTLRRISTNFTKHLKRLFKTFTWHPLLRIQAIFGKRNKVNYFVACEQSFHKRKEMKESDYKLLDHLGFRWFIPKIIYQSHKLGMWCVIKILLNPYLTQIIRSNMGIIYVRPDNASWPSVNGKCFLILFTFTWEIIGWDLILIWVWFCDLGLNRSSHTVLVCLRSLPLYLYLGPKLPSVLVMPVLN